MLSDITDVVVVVVVGAAVGESVDPCCASQASANDSRNDEASIM